TTIASSAQPPTHAPNARRSRGASSQTHANALLRLKAADSAVLARIFSRKEASRVRNTGFEAEPFKHLVRGAHGRRNDGQAAFLFDNRNRGQGRHLHTRGKDQGIDAV